MDLSLFSDQITVSNKPVVLAVDDNIDNLALMECQIAMTVSCAVVTAATGRAALHLAQHQLPDLILLDILLPDLNGIEVVRKLRQTPATAKIPIIALTALAKDEERDRILSAGCDCYLSKPYDLNDLEAIIFRYLPQQSLL
jgi:two-component system, cell cycle response regulator DivK